MCTHTRRITLAALGAITLVAAGCGPTATGLEARDQARDRLDSVHAKIAFEQSQQSFETGQLEDALGKIDAAIGRFDEAPDFHLHRGRVLLEMHRLQPALAAFERAIELEETTGAASYFAGVVHERWANHEAAAEHYAAAFEQDGSNAHHLLASAESLVALDHHDEARALLTGNLDYFEHNPAMHQLLGQIAVMEDRYDDAVASYDQARLYSPDDPRLLEEAAWVQFEAGRYGKALDSLGLLRGVFEVKRPDLQHLEARCLAFMGRQHEARDLYITLVEDAPQNVDLWLELGRVSWEIGDLARTGRCGRQVMQLDAKEAEAFVLQAVAARATGNRGDAIEHLRRACELDPDDLTAQALLAHTLEQDGRFGEARSAYERALDLADDSSAREVIRERLDRPVIRLSAVEPS